MTTKNAYVAKMEAQLKELGAGYTNCAPAPEARLLQSLQAQLSEARKLLG